MEWQFLLVSAALGAAGGAVGWLITRKARTVTGGRMLAIRVGCVVVAATAGTQLIRPFARQARMRRDLHAEALGLYGNEESATLHTNLMIPILESPAFETRIKQVKSGASSGAPLAGAQTGVAELAAKGMARLEPAELAAIFDVKRALAEKSPGLCAGFWTGQITPDELKAGLRAISKEQQAVWITVSSQALSREVAAAPRPPGPAEAATTGAMNELMAALPPDQQAAIAAAGEGTPTPKVACDAFRALAAGLQKLAPAKRAMILRALSAPPTDGKN